MPQIRTRDGQSLHVRVLGKRTGEPVLLLPGLGMNSAHWLPFVLPYAGRFRFHLPDFRGFGRSSSVRLNQADIFQNHAEDVLDLIAHFGLRDYLLGGISLGGSTALHIQRAHGFQGVRRYLHIDQSPCVGNREGWSYGLFGARQPELFAELERVRALLDAHPRARAFADLPGDARRDAADTLARVVVLVGGRAALEPLVRKTLMMPRAISGLLPLSDLDDVRAYLASYASGGHDYRESLRACETPITVMVGMGSPLYDPRGQMAIADYAPRARVVRFERSGHVPLVDQPLAFGRELGRFLNGA